MSGTTVLVRFAFRADARVAFCFRRLSAVRFELAVAAMRSMMTMGAMLAAAAPFSIDMAQNHAGAHKLVHEFFVVDSHNVPFRLVSFLIIFRLNYNKVAY
jgi:alcohol dehydrogenase class IV